MRNNAREVYKQYTSGEIERARITVRTLMEDPKWKTVTDYRSYRTYFQLDSSPELGSAKEPQKQQELRKYDIEVHSLLAFYHQVSLLLEGKLLPENIIMQLLGEGLEDRWQFLEPIPRFYSKYAYRGMNQLYEWYCR